MKLHVIILAAGEGKRMKSSLPKVLHEVGGKPLLWHVYQTAVQLQPQTIHIVYGHGGEAVRKRFPDIAVNWVFQGKQLGTGHAVLQVLPAIPTDSLVLVLYGDVPLISLATLQTLIEATAQNSLSLLVAKVNDPTGLGRIIRNHQGEVQAIIEHKDANNEQLIINEIFTGMLAANAGSLLNWLSDVKNDNAQGEYYLPDVVAMAIQKGLFVPSVECCCIEEVLGINDKSQLAFLERYYQQQQVQALLKKAVTVRDPSRLDIRGEVYVEQDVILDVNVILEGTVNIGANTFIGPNTVVRNAQIGSNVIIKENCVIEDSIIDDGCTIGPFARLRPGTHLAKNAHIGNFVEIKKSHIGMDSKVNHLSYVGDSLVGESVNVGAGTITCNYDGVHKHQTIIESHSFIGSGTQLVAPVTIGQGATIGAGSVITKDAPAGELSLSRTPQCSVPGWQRPQKQQREGE